MQERLVLIGERQLATEHKYMVAKMVLVLTYLNIFINDAGSGLTVH